MPNKVFALVDCNNFFVSCERIFQPRYHDKPVVVLSNNDGCVVSRSNEVKALGIPMASPIFKSKDKVAKNKIKVFSSNYTLYDDLSQRVMQTLRNFTPSLEVYSIDEAFLEFGEIEDRYSLTHLGGNIRNMIHDWVGIPVSIGFAKTKTLSKLATEIGKKDKGFQGIFDFTKIENPDKYLEEIPVGDVWGIGWQYQKKLKLYGIETAKDLKYADRIWMKNNFSVMGERIILELNDISCYPLVTNYRKKKNIAYTRSFGKYQNSLRSLSEAVSTYTAGAATKLRAQHSLTSFVQVFILTNTHSKHLPQYANSTIIKLHEPSDHTPTLVKFALYGLDQIYRSGFQYKKAGVIFHHLIPKSSFQFSLLEPFDEKLNKKRKELMNTLDTVNRKWGKYTLKYAVEGTTKNWWMNQSLKSPRYTTSWHELPLVHY